MAKSSDHIALASKNQIALSTLIRDQPNHSEWIVAREWRQENGFDGSASTS